MDSIDVIIERRFERAGLADDVAIYVMAALDGTLDRLTNGESEETGAARRQPATEATAPARAFLKRVSVTAFRGIGPQTNLEVAPGPGLTLVIGANGTGKSSFAEGLEFLLTGENSRWEGKSREWREGWRNRHSEAAPLLQAHFAVEGVAGPAVVSRRWRPEATELDAHTVDTEIVGERGTGLANLGWETALETHRPFLSYSQLSEIVEKGPSARFDAMAAGLGLEKLTEARERLRDRRLRDQSTLKKAREEIDGLLGELEALDDERARTVRAALTREPWGLDSVYLVLEGGLDDDADRPLDLLRRMATIDFPSPEEVEDLCRELRDAYPRLEAIKDSNAARARRLAEVLSAAVEVHEQDGEQPCPVCQTGRIDDRWRITAQERYSSLWQEAEEANRAAELLHGLAEKCESLTHGPPGWLVDAERVGIDASDVRRAWKWWEYSHVDEPSLPVDEELWPDDAFHVEQIGSIIRDRSGIRFRPSLPSGPDSAFTMGSQGLLEIAGRLTERGAQVRAALEPLREQARAELDRRENLWRPLSRRLMDWLPAGRRGQQAAKRLPAIQVAEDWLAGEEDDIRAERFRPIAQRARDNWKLMGRGSSVSLDDLALTGQANARRLDLATSIDGEDGAALAVMSQGELNALSLSLFLARAVLPDSPFGFLVIDDPVQAMDPVKVEGLARVLAEAARERQVIVFTHDGRLPAAVRRLRIEHRTLAVRRREGSMVTCTPVENPVQQHLDDARTVLLTDGLDESTRRRVIPGFCRQAIEAACIEAVRRSRAEAGRDLIETEKDISRARTLNQKLALALLDDAEGAYEDMTDSLSKHFRGLARAVVRDCNRGAHGPLDQDLKALIHDAEWLAERLQEHGRR